MLSVHSVYSLYNLSAKYPRSSNRSKRIDGYVASLPQRFRALMVVHGDERVKVPRESVQERILIDARVHFCDVAPGYRVI